jgi:hypothetical protein
LIRTEFNDGASLGGVTFPEVGMYTIGVPTDELRDEISEAMVHSNADERCRV